MNGRSQAVRTRLLAASFAVVLGTISLVAIIPTTAGAATGQDGPTTTTLPSTSTSTLPSTSTSTSSPTVTPEKTPIRKPLDGVEKYLSSRKGVAQVAVFDEGTGQTSTYSNGTAVQATASIVKADILAMWLHNYQEKGVSIPSGIPYSIRYLMQQMIQASDNAAATALFYYGGGCTALTSFNTLIPTKDTTIGCETPTYYGWGNTTTSAVDQVSIVKTYAYPNAILGSDARTFGLGLMENIQSGQNWGVSCGPWGTTCQPPDYSKPVPGVTVALKNGWKYVPSCTAQDTSCPWQINSIGWVSGKGRNYVVAVLTTGNPAGPGLDGFNYGVDTIQGVSRLIWDNLAPAS